MTFNRNSVGSAGSCSRNNSPARTRILFLRFCKANAEFTGESELDTFVSDNAPFENFLKV